MKIKKLFKKYDLSIISVVVFLVLWEIGGRLNLLPVDYIGMPSKIMVEFVHLLNPTFLGSYLLPSLEALIIGLTASIVLGVVLGFLIGVNPIVRKIFKPFMLALNAIPVIVFFPFFILIFGISLQSVITTIIIMCAIPILINVVEGVANTDPQLMIMAKSFNATSSFVVSEVVFFSSLPYIFSSIRAAIGKAIVALVIAEIYGLNKGIGYLISYYGSSFHVDKLMGIVLIILLINVILSSILWWVEKSFNKFNNRKVTA
jgi:NitT/TauT family transport system permease protein